MTGSDDSMALLLNCMNGLRTEVRKIRRQVQNDTKPAFTNQEIMDMFGIASSTLKKWRDTGEIGFSCKGNMYYYTKKDITDFLERNHYEAFAQMM